MNSFDYKRNKKVFEIIVILKIIYIVSSLLAIASFYELERKTQSIIVMVGVFSVILVIVLGYFLWIFYKSKNKVNNKQPNLIDYIETFIHILIFVLVIVMTGMHNSGYKLLSIFIVLIASIQFGKVYGVAVSLIPSMIILLINVIFTNGNKELLSIYFERDLVLSVALFVTAFILGMYVDTEKEHSNELKELANKDELTGLYNHRYFQEFLQKTLLDSEKNMTEVSLLFMDIDYFKNYNDVNGHQAGDLLLKQIGTILRESIRNSDVVARYGGEEFAAILPNTNENNAIEIGEKIRSAIQNTTFAGQENQPNKNITISIGVSSYPKRAINKHQLINTADDALYRAKSFNKNRVESYHSVLDDLCKEINVKEDVIRSLKTFISMINLKDRYTYAHTERVVIYVKRFAESLNLKEEEKIQLQIAAYLHDIGKLEIPEDVLNKKGKLTNEEYEMLKNHPQAGVELISNVKEFELFVPLIKHHHEKYDGSGYPSKLSGESIPYLARILTIADSFDAMTSNRPYNVRKSHKEGIEELRKNTCSQFDPDLVEKFIKMLEEKM